MGHAVLGTCGSCGGAVTVPVVWMGINPPTPTCTSCGRHPVEAHGRVLPMKDQRKRDMASLRNDDLDRILTRKPQDRKTTPWIDEPRYITRSFEK